MNYPISHPTIERDSRSVVLDFYEFAGQTHAVFFAYSVERDGDLEIKRYSPDAAHEWTLEENNG